MIETIPPVIYLIGMPGSGKTTLGPKLADHLQRPFYDLDAFIEEQAGISISEIFRQVGETGFRQKEAAALRQLSAEVTNAVIATGGGTPCFEGNLPFMNETGIPVYLEVSVEELADRLSRQDLKKRPLLAGKNKAELVSYLTEMLDQRQNFYRQAKVIARPGSSDAIFLEKLINALRSGA